ncbi:MAG: hypothetical protein AB7L13_23885 [Acidimicrobiia bacterium]
MTVDLTSKPDAEARAYQMAASIEAEYGVEVGIVELLFGGFELVYQVGAEVRTIGVVAR